MTVFIVPPLEPEGETWPTLGPQVCDFIEGYLVHGKGDLLGVPAHVDDETRGWIYRAYEVYPADHAQAGRRRFKTVGISQRKGLAKTEKGAWIVAAELHHEGPVRCDGFDSDGAPVGVGIIDPYIPMVAFAEEQAEELAFGTLVEILKRSAIAGDFDIALERILRADGTGRAEALAAAPNSRDGARTTFQYFDETHRLVSQRHRDAHQTMQGNIPKRRAADPWSLETTTMPEPGSGSIAEATLDYAKAVDEGKIRNPRIFFFHRQASDEHDLSTDEGRRAAIIEASGPEAIKWTDVESILSLWDDPRNDPAYLERVWLNRLVQAARQAFDIPRLDRNVWDVDERGPRPVAPGRLIVLGFDGSRFRDATGIVATDVETGYQWVVACWERPKNAPKDWEVPEREVDAKMTEAFETSGWNVWRLYADPQWWETSVNTWAGRWRRDGHERVVRFWTHRERPMSEAIRDYRVAIRTGDQSWDGDERFRRHMANARSVATQLNVGEDEEPLILISKERRDSPNVIDLSMAGTLSWEGRGDAIADDALNNVDGPSVGWIT